MRIARFTARAGKGTISAGGTIGLAAPMPVALTLTARNASPLASDQLTAVLDADLSLRGEARGAAGRGRQDHHPAGRNPHPRAHLPATVAVLDVRRPGPEAAAPAGARRRRSAWM